MSHVSTHSVAACRSILSSAACTADFFTDGRFQNLGDLKQQAKSGHLTLLDQPVQKCYKSLQWWSESQHENLSKARRSRLSQQYKNQLDQVYQWMAMLEEHGKLLLLLELIKQSTPDIVNYLAQCLIQRMREKMDISILPDQLLLLTFSYLPPQDIKTISQVCRHWRYLCARDELWVIKCHEMGLDAGIPNVIDIVMETSQDYSIDWQVAYRQLKALIAETIEATSESAIAKQSTGEAKIVDLSSKKSKKKGQSSSVRTTQSQKASNGSDSESEVFEDLAYGVMDIDSVSVYTTAKSLKSRRSRSGATIRSAVSRKSSRNLKSKSKMTAKSLHSTKQEEADQDLQTTSLVQINEPTVQRRKHAEDDEEFVLDVRPQHHQATDLLGKTVLSVSKKSKEKLTLSQIVGRPRAFYRVRKLQGHMNAVLCVHFDQRRLFSGSLDRSIRIWDIRSGRPIHKLHGHKGGINCMEFSNERLYSGSWDTTIMVWDIVHFTHVCTLDGHTGAITSLQLHPAKNTLISGSHDKTIRIWSTITHHCANVITGHIGPVTCIHLLSSQKVLSGSTDRCVKLSSTAKAKGTLKTFFGPKNAISAVLGVGSLVICGTADGGLFFWNKAGRGCEAAVKAHESTISAIGYSNNRLFTASTDTTIKEWDLQTLTCIRVIQGHRGPVLDIKVSLDHLVSCSEDGTVRIYDFNVSPSSGSKEFEDTIHTEVLDQTLLP